MLLCAGAFFVTADAVEPRSATIGFTPAVLRAAERVADGSIDVDHRKGKVTEERIRSEPDENIRVLANRPSTVGRRD
jgi:hypothetical protein